MSKYLVVVHCLNSNIGIYKYYTDIVPREGEMLHLPTYQAKIKRILKVKSVHHHFGIYEDHGPHMETEFSYFQLNCEFWRDEETF